MDSSESNTGPMGPNRFLDEGLEFGKRETGCREPGEIDKEDRSLCAIPGCSRKARPCGKCTVHYSQQWNQDNRERYNENWNRFYARNTERRRRKGLRQSLRKYGVSEEDYDRVYAE